METPKELCKRIEGDVEQLLKMYDLAQQAYPYENLHGGRLASDANQRMNLQKFGYTEDPTNILKQPSAMPLAFLYMMSRAGAAHPLDFSQLFKSPSRAFGWLLLGNSILMLWRIRFVAQVRQNNPQLSQFHTRVHNNEQTHSILRSMKFHLHTRQYSFEDAVPK